MLKLGTTSIGKIYLGSTKIAKAYLGDTLVYESGSTPPTPHDYSQDYLTFEALEDSVFTLTIGSVGNSNMTSVSYSIDNGQTWVTTNNGNASFTVTTPTITLGNKVLWKGVGNRMAISSSKTSKFNSTGNFNVYGNIMSLLYGDNFINKITFPGTNDYGFARLFRGVAKIISIEHLILPATSLGKYCYYLMFYNCASLITAPPELPATTLANRCYDSMFTICKSLTTPPKLPATILADGCYSNMFSGCTALTQAPELPATTLPNTCYWLMFKNCNNINYIKAMFTEITYSGSTYYWVDGVAATGTFVKNSAATWTTTGVDGVPTGWTVQTANS